MSDEELRMSFTEHLGELRVRLIRSGITVAVAAIVCYIFSETIFVTLAYPLESMMPKPEDGEAAKSLWTTLNPFEYFIFSLKVAGYSGLCVAMPVIIYELCAFIFPGLKPSEKRAARVLLIGGFLLSSAGTMLAYFGVLPFVLPYLTSFMPEMVELQLQVGPTIAIIVKALLGFGIAFQFPMIVLILVYLGILTPESLKQYRKVVIVGLAVGSAMLTPPDPVTMSVMLVPLYALFESSIWLSYFVARSRNRAEESS